MLQLKKSVVPEDVCQAKCELLLANLRSPRLRPVTVLTDLRESWQLLWLDGRRLVTATGSPQSAVKTIQGLVQQVRSCMCRQVCSFWRCLSRHPYPH